MRHAQNLFQQHLQNCGLIAILRGITPAETAAAGETLYRAGFRLIEIPLNSPRAFDSIKLLRAAVPADCLVGAGTVLRAEDCQRLAGIGAELVVMPHSDPAVIAAAKAAGRICLAGVATPTEAFAALAAGADALKLFPAEQLGLTAVRAWRAVMPADLALLPVGGIRPDSLAAYRAAGASGFGLGSALYQPGISLAELSRRATQFMAAWHAAYDAA